MSKYVTKQELEVILQKLDLVEDITFYRHPSVGPSVDKSDKWYQNIGGKCLDEVVDRLDNDDSAIIADLNLLLDHLGLEVTEKKDRRIVKKVKKGKK